MTNSKTIFLMIATMMILTVGFGSQNAFAVGVDYVISAPGGGDCTTLLGSWDGIDTCTINGRIVTISSEDILTVDENVTLFIDGDSVFFTQLSILGNATNFGTLKIFGPTSAPDGNGSIGIGPQGILTNCATISLFGDLMHQRGILSNTNFEGKFFDHGVTSPLTLVAGVRTIVSPPTEPCITTISVDIDIKPGSDPNCFNNNGHGVIPVAILGSDTFDVTQVDTTTITLDGQETKTKGNGNPLVAIEDVNNDGFDDMVVKILDIDGTYIQGDGNATLSGNLLDGTEIEGTDSICITQ